jgi:alkylation response protein AidB-like acyl-CoA dehydrogenase
MQIFKPPVKDIHFLLEAFDYANEVGALDTYSSYDLDTVVTMAEHSGNFCAQELLPLNRSGDQEGIHYDPQAQTITMPKGFKELYQKYAETGFLGLAQPEQYGGGGAPHTLGVIVGEMVTATNKSFSMCPGLTTGLADALVAHGSEAQKIFYLPKLLSGQWSATMCLTEPHCGTDLGLLSTKAVPFDDHYKVTGTKIWITFGEHDLADNIIHLVLARLPDAPPGIKGISVFLVPKILEDGKRNAAYCTGVEHKMGIHASPTCVMNFEDAEGWLMGEPHRGMRSMFVMMNTARLNVGAEGTALAEIAYQTALEFAKERRQSRSLNPKLRDTNEKADNILVHPDVRRMLMNIKATNEGMRALLYWTAMQLDKSTHHPDTVIREKAANDVALFTPVIKSFLTERGCELISEAMQVCGGAGYTQDWSIEQYFRDARIAMIYEGTNHIQALDLVGRKLPMKNGALLKQFTEKVESFVKEHQAKEELHTLLHQLGDGLTLLKRVTDDLVGASLKAPDVVGARASNYLKLLALVAIAYLWCRQAAYALGQDNAYAQTKLKTAHYFFDYIYPEILSLADILSKPVESLMDIDPKEFEVH